MRCLVYYNPYTARYRRECDAARNSYSPRDYPSVNKVLRLLLAAAKC